VAEPPQVLLASSSPRRLELLRRIGVEPTVVAPDVDEPALRGEVTADDVRRLAQWKADAVPVARDVLVVAADTLVVVDGRALGKPETTADAETMLRALSGRTHQVLTGVAVRRGDHHGVDLAATRVSFRPLSEADIDWYVATGEPRGKAGAYAIQGAGEAFVERIDGSYSNVVGLPLALTIRLAREAGVVLVGA
jgi:septum formation protein